jgi:hypothetical protein
MCRLNEKTIQEIKLAREEFRQGKFITHEEVKIELKLK